MEPVNGRQVMGLGRAISAVLVRMALLPDGGAMRYDADKVSGGKAESSPPPRLDSLADEWSRRFAQLLQVAERDLRMAQTGATRSPRRVDAARDARIVSYRLHGGNPPEWVAFVEDVSASHVEKVRKREGLDPRTGERVRKSRPLTAPAPGDDEGSMT